MCQEEEERRRGYDQGQGQGQGQERPMSMAEKRAAMLRSGSILYCDETQERKKREDLELEFTRWGGRKDYSQSQNDRKRKAALEKIHKRKVKMEKRKSLREQESFRSTNDDKPKHGFHDLWGFAFKQDQLEYDQLIKEDKDRELVASYCEEPFWKFPFVAFSVLIVKESGNT